MKGVHHSRLFRRGGECRALYPVIAQNIRPRVAGWVAYYSSIETGYSRSALEGKC